jgi:hypothetical protein
MFVLNESDFRPSRFVEYIVRGDEPAITSFRFAQCSIGSQMPRVVTTHHCKEAARIDEQFIRQR